VKATPSPAPGIDHINPDDFMTWGEIESTPIVVGDDGPQFTMSDVPRRQMIASQLQDQASRSFRKRTGAGSERRGTGGETPGAWGTTPGGKSSHGHSVRAAAMSPAAAALLGKLTGKGIASSSIMTGVAGSFKRMTSYPTNATPVETVVNKKRRTDMPKDQDVDTSGLLQF
jgi:hypothetical protein